MPSDPQIGNYYQRGYYLASPRTHTRLISLLPILLLSPLQLEFFFPPWVGKKTKQNKTNSKSSYIFPSFSYLILVFSVAKSCLILRLRLLNKQDKNLVSSFMRGFSCSG